MKVLETQDPELWGQNSSADLGLVEKHKNIQRIIDNISWRTQGPLDVLAVAGCVTPSLLSLQWLTRLGT